jgi:hydrogenase nickel incorporation protein HypB
MCHLDAAMCEQGLHNMGIDGLDLVFLENVGNLICPAEFDTGAGAKVMILSAPEGHDKPLKYPLMFEVSDLVIVSKMDVAPYFDFDLDELEKNVRMRNPNATILPLSAKTGEGMDAWCDWLRAAVKEWKV